MLHWKAPWKRERKGLGTFIAKVEMGLERQMDCIGPDPAGGGDQGRGKSVAEQALALEKRSNRSSRERSVFLCPLYQMGNNEQSKQMLDSVNKWIEPLLLIQGAQLAMKMCYMNRIRT